MTKVKLSDGPVTVTGASGYIGLHAVISLMKRGYTVRACIRDPNNPDKTEPILALNNGDYPGKVELFTANLLKPNSYDTPFADCSAIIHIATTWGTARQRYEGAVNGVKNVLESIKKTGTVKRLIFTSSFAAIHHPMKSGYAYTEQDWASDNRENDLQWDLDKIDDDAEISYAMGKVEAEHIVYRFAENEGSFDAISINPIVVLGPLLSKVHHNPGSWQWHLGNILSGTTIERQWNSLWNCVDVRDVAESHALAMESNTVKNGDRFQLSATDESGELDAFQIQKHLEKLFPAYKIGAPPSEIHPIIEKYGAVFQAPIARCDKAREELGLKTHSIDDTLRETGQTLIDLGLVKPTLK